MSTVEELQDEVNDLLKDAYTSVDVEYDKEVSKTLCFDYFRQKSSQELLLAIVKQNEIIIKLLGEK